MSAFRYSCPDTCRPPQCFCPRPDPPGGLSPAHTPQFVLLSFDDAVDQKIFDFVHPIFTHIKNPNGCPISATFFITTDYSDYWLIERLSREGHEIAVHTMTHKTNEKTDLKTWRAEIIGARDAFAKLSQISKDKIIGFRAPFLHHNKESFQVVFDEHFLYDSSVTETVGYLSKDPLSRIWPYTLDYGIAQRCFVGICPEKAFPGLFEIPLYAWSEKNGQEKVAMDPLGSREEIRDLLLRNFRDRLRGNRAPFCVFLHGQWLQDEGHRAALLDLLDEATKERDVWFVSLTQLIEFMRRPKPSAEVGSLFQCPSNPSGPEICDGRDNDGNGEVDEGLVHECRYPEGSFRTCAPCPTVWPTVRK